MFARGSQRPIYNCRDDSAENHFLNDNGELIVPSAFDYYNQGYGGSPCVVYAYPNYTNWSAYNCAHSAYIASLWQNYFYGENNYSHDPYAFGQMAHSAAGCYYYPPSQELYATQAEASWNDDVSQRAPIYVTPPSRNSRIQRVSPDSTQVKEQQLINTSPGESASSATATSSSSTTEKVATATNSSSISPIMSSTSEEASVGPMATVYGTISVYLRRKIRVDLTIDKAIRLTNYSTGTIASMSSDGFNICLIHENGKAILENEIVHHQCQEILAKITKRGVTFTALKNSLIYLVDDSGTKSTTERFRDMDRDFSVDLFYSGSTHGPEYVEDCVANLDRKFHRSYAQGDETWAIAGVKIKQDSDGEVKVTRDFGRLALRLSPTSGNVSVSMENTHMSASNNDDKLFFVRHGENRLISHKDGFTVRHGTQKAGLDSAGQIILS